MLKKTRKSSNWATESQSSKKWTKVCRQNFSNSKKSSLLPPSLLFESRCHWTDPTTRANPRLSSVLRSKLAKESSRRHPPKTLKASSKKRLWMESRAIQWFRKTLSLEGPKRQPRTQWWSRKWIWNRLRKSSSVSRVSKIRTCGTGMFQTGPTEEYKTDDRNAPSFLEYQ